MRELDAGGARGGRARSSPSSPPRDTPIRAYRRPRVTPATLRDFARHIARAARRSDRDNEYLRPSALRRRTTCASGRAPRPRGGSTEPLDAARPFVYFPLHVTDDYKIKRVIPHCVDQASIIEQVADALPHGYDLVLKEHPMSIGRNRARRCCGGWRAIPNVAAGRRRTRARTS